METNFYWLKLKLITKNPAITEEIRIFTCIEYTFLLALK